MATTIAEGDVMTRRFSFLASEEEEISSVTECKYRDCNKEELSKKESEADTYTQWRA